MSTENQEPNDEYSFSNMTKSILDEETEVDAPSSSQSESDEGSQVGQELDRITQLQEELAEQRRIAEEANEKMNRLSNALSDTKPEDKEQKEREERIRKFDVDPLTGVNNIVEEQVSSLRNEINSMKSTRIAQLAMDDIDKEWDVDWESNKQKIKHELETLNPEFRRNNPKAALLKAAQFAGVANKKDKMPMTLYPGSTPKEREKYIKSREEAYMDSIERGKQSSGGGSVLDMWN